MPTVKADEFQTDALPDFPKSATHANHLESYNAGLQRRSTNTYAKNTDALQRTLEPVFTDYSLAYWVYENEQS